MKVGSAVLGLHIAVACVFALLQGCITTESQGSGRGAGARHKGPWKHEHKGKATSNDMLGQDAMDFGQGDAMGFDPVVIDTTTSNLPEPTPAPAPSEIYIVQKGDMLSQLAVDFDTTVQTLVNINGLDNPDVLYVGQELRVPAGRSTSPRTIKKQPSIKRGGSYVIQKGDTLSGIAVAAKVSINDLRELNNIQGDKIFAGEKLSIPAYGKVPTKVSKPKSKPKIEEAPPVEPAPLAPATSEVVAPSRTATTTTLNEVVDHLVYPGETLDDIARQHGASKSEIMRMNNLSSETDIAEGMRLRIPIAE